MAKQVSKYLLLLSTMAFIFEPSLRANCQSKNTETGQEAIEAVSVKLITENPKKYLKKTVQLSGRLENEGENYFTDLRVILKDGQGHFIYVRPWLPFELPPSPPGSTGKRPPVLSQYLGKEVELTAVVDRGTLKKVGGVYLLDVKSAKVVK